MAAPFIWQQLHFPWPLEPDHVLRLLGRLAADASRATVVLEACGEGGLVHHRIGTQAHQVRAVTDAVTTSIPGTLLSTIDEPTPPARVGRVTVADHGLSLQSDQSLALTRAIHAALAAARYQGEQLVLQIVLGAGIPPRLLPDNPADPTQSVASTLARGVRPAGQAVAASMRHKATEPGIRTVIRIGITAASEGRHAALRDGLLAALRLMQSPGTRITSGVDRAPLGRLPGRHGGTAFAISELVGIIGWPIGREPLPGMPNPHPRQLPLRGKALPKDRSFGVTTAPGLAQPVGIGITDALQHTVLLGPTGAGKSTALLHLILADIDAGRSVVVIDPKGDLVSDVLARAPERRADDVVVLDPSHDRPVGLNPLAAPDTPPELIADGILAIVRDLYPQAFGPRTADVLHASLLTLASTPGSTLALLPRLLTDARFRRSLVAKVRDDVLLDYWAEFDGLSNGQQIQHIGPVLSRLRQFLLRPSLRRVLDQPEPRFDLRDVVTSSPVLLVPLNEGLLGRDSSRLLGSLLVSRLWQLALARAGSPAASRRPVSIYIDEAQQFLRLGGDELADALARSRSLGVAWHLAHQYRAQMPKDLLSAIDANARNKIVFSLPSDDARAMAAMAPELTPEDFMALPKHHVYAQLMRDGQNLGWISATTSPAPEPTNDAARLIRGSQRRYGRLVTEVPPAEVDPPDAPIGRKRRQS